MRFTPRPASPSTHFFPLKTSLTRQPNPFSLSARGVRAFADWSVVSHHVPADSRELSSLYAESTLLKSATETIGFLMVVCSVDGFWAQLSQEGYLLDEFSEVRSSPRGETKRGRGFVGFIRRSCACLVQSCL